MMDNFTEQFTTHARKERLNEGPPRPAGTLAARVLELPREMPRAQFKPEKIRKKLERLMRDITAPTRDFWRLIDAVGEELAWQNFESSAPLRDEPILALALRQLAMVRKIVETIIKTSLDAPSGALDPNYDKALNQMVRWIRCTKTEDHFLATPAGTVLLSALYGLHRGGLLVCARCGRFEPAVVTGFRRKYCKKCSPHLEGKDLSPFLVEKNMFLKLVIDRMRKRRERTRELSDQEDWMIWEENARRTLEVVKTHEELDTWEKEIVPERKRGRPRRDKPDSAS